VDYSQLTPLGTSSVVDPNMKDSKGYNADIGYRGAYRNVLNFDISAFYMAYNDRPGIELKQDELGEYYTFRTNVANSVHQGLESYIELDFLSLIKPDTKSGLRIFNSFSFVDARYTSGEYEGHMVAYAPKYINRIGLIFNAGGFSTSLQWSHQTKSYADAANTEFSEDPIVGVIPAYKVIDWSTTYRIRKLGFKAGVNNLTDERYFTERTDEYPGPGIIPSIGRSFYVGISATLD